jgi:hypothetical protein
VKRNKFQRVVLSFNKTVDLTVVVPLDYTETELKVLSERLIQQGIDDFETVVPSQPWLFTYTQEPVVISAEHRVIRKDLYYGASIPEHPESVLADKSIYVLSDSGDMIVSPRDASWWVASDEDVIYERQHEPNPAQLELFPI